MFCVVFLPNSPSPARGGCQDHGPPGQAMCQRNAQLSLLNLDSSRLLSTPPVRSGSSLNLGPLRWPRHGTKCSEHPSPLRSRQDQPVPPTPQEKDAEKSAWSPTLMGAHPVSPSGWPKVNVSFGTDRKQVTTEIPSKPPAPRHDHVPAFPWPGCAGKSDLCASWGQTNSVWTVSEPGWLGPGCASGLGGGLNDLHRPAELQLRSIDSRGRKPHSCPLGELACFALTRLPSSPNDIQGA